MDRADWIVTIAGALAVWIAYAVIDHEPAADAARAAGRHRDAANYQGQADYWRR